MICFHAAILYTVADESAVAIDDPDSVYPTSNHTRMAMTRHKITDIIELNLNLLDLFIILLRI